MVATKNTTKSTKKPTSKFDIDREDITLTIVGIIIVINSLGYDWTLWTIPLMGLMEEAGLSKHLALLIIMGRLGFRKVIAGGNK